MLTPEGHRDVIEMREGLKPDRYNLPLPVAPALVMRRLRPPVAERIRPMARSRHRWTVPRSMPRSPR
jgi:N-methylhydantoinase A